jgi:hypothetical protein
MNDYMMDQPRVVPYALPPGENAAKALNIRLVSQFQVDWPFTRLIVGGLGEFIDRWVGWFGDAAQLDTLAFRTSCQSADSVVPTGFIFQGRTRCSILRTRSATELHGRDQIARVSPQAAA